MTRTLIMCGQAFMGYRALCSLSTSAATGWFGGTGPCAVSECLQLLGTSEGSTWGAVVDQVPPQEDEDVVEQGEAAGRGAVDGAADGDARPRQVLDHLHHLHKASLSDTSTPEDAADQQMVMPEHARSLTTSTTCTMLDCQRCTRPIWPVC